MNQQTSPRDLEQISAYLDGQLSQADSARLAARIQTDSELRSVYESLRQSQALLRKLPARRAPRNFRLTPKMAGVKPPLPRVFPVFRLASAFAAILFFLGYALNLSAPLAASVGAPVSFAYGGGNSEAAPEDTQLYASDAGPTDTAASKIAPPLDNYGETPTPETMMLAVPSTEESPQPDVNAARSVDLPVAPPSPALPISPAWLFGLLGLAVVSGAGAFLVRARTEWAWNKANGAGPAHLGSRDILWIALAVVVVLLLALAVYWMSTGFNLQAANAMDFPSGGPGGDKGNVPAAMAQEIQFTPGTGYNFSAANEQGLVTAIDFPPDALVEKTRLHFIPGLDTVAPDSVASFPDRAFTLFPEGKSAWLQAPLTVSMEYGNELVSVAGENTLALYWWSGSEWRDAVTTCSPASIYNRIPDSNRIEVTMCEFGTFLLVAP